MASKFTAELERDSDGDWRVKFHHPLLWGRGTVHTYFHPADDSPEAVDAARLAAEEFAKRLTMPLPDPDAPLPHAVPTDPTVRDGEMVPTWRCMGGDELGGLVKSGEWECSLGDYWSYLGDDEDCVYLVRRTAPKPPEPPQPQTERVPWWKALGRRSSHNGQVITTAEHDPHADVVMRCGSGPSWCVDADGTVEVLCEPQDGAS